MELRVEVTPQWVFRLPAGGGADGVLRHRGGVLERLVHVGDEAAIVRCAQRRADTVVFGAWADSREVCEEAIARMRFATGVDDDLSGFHARFRDDPLIGASVRRRPWLRVLRRPEPFEALAWAICEQLIEFTRAVQIERRIVRRLGRRCEETGLRDLPTAAQLAGTAPALLQSFDLSAGRALALTKCAREVATGRADLRTEHEAAWARLRRIPNIGQWTIDVLALYGQGRYDMLPAGDLGFLKLVGRLDEGGNPHARAEEARVRELFAPYEEWAGLAGVHALGGANPQSPSISPAQAGTRSSGRWAAAAA